MPRCGHMFHDKCIQTWKASCKSEPNYGVCPQCRKPFRKLLSFYKLRGTLPRQDPKAQLIPRAGQHIDSTGTSSIHLFWNCNLNWCTKAPYYSTTSLHLLSYTCPFGFIFYKRNLFNFFRKKISPEILAQKYRKIPSQNLSKEKSLQFFSKKSREILIKKFVKEKSR